MNHDMEKIEKRRRIRVGIYVLHFGLLIGGLVYLVLAREHIFAIVGGSFFLYSAAADLLDKTSTVRAPIHKFGIRSIDWDLRALDWIMVGLLASLVIAEGIALVVYEPSQLWPLPVWIPFFLTAVLTPLVVFGWMFDRSRRGVLFTFVRSGFRFPPPADEFWNDVRANHQEIRATSPVYLTFLVSIALQSLMLSVWSGSISLLVLWSILVTSLLKDLPLTRKADPIPSPPTGYYRSR